MVQEVIYSEQETVIRVDDVALRVYVGKADADQPFLLGHLYQVRGGFVQVKTYVFEAMGKADLEAMKKVVDFFFASLLDTEWYIKEVPRDSLLFAQEAVRLYGEEHDGAVCVIR